MTQLEKDNFYMEFAIHSASKSKDSSTKVGACLVNDKRLLSIGYNGAPRNFPDDTVPTVQDSSFPLKNQKNAYMVHAELNAILNYGGSLNDLQGSTLYVTISPCHECAKVIIQTGVKRVVYLKDYHRGETCEMAKMLFRISGVKCEQLEVKNDL